MTKPKTIYCASCNAYVPAELVTGADVYPHRSDLRRKQFWRCPTCRNSVGCHRNSAKPLGVIPTQELKAARQHIHALIDPVWKSGRLSRANIYSHLSGVIGREYHTAGLRSIEEARTVYAAAREMIRGL